ncbi:Lrp/AsnC family transcriptional regulator [Streptomyces diastatochromogenes]|uniref:AsnC family transcriptional regulator n=1 Tax=Streptomyces diastatochromogenes TaxID=42236 RepID=A0A233RRT2_STRDA|nr:Lrp/AsnC family transcriptional regulator [Streptomyces diastatochromogenes]MCZ0984736.1 Lrp/AsnC family transcriptional regulator [Streptomyces diastatochromogenes]OXY86094.1 AsnC family transcriptional regulator [Streptomyces diastatochromogenes]
MESQPLDTVDLKLLHALQLDGRVPFSRVAEVLGVSDPTIARRFRRLRTTVGLRVVGMTDESLLGQQSWIVRLRCTPDVAEQLAGALARRPDTKYIELISGGTEVLCAMMPRSQQDRDELLFDRLQRTPRIISVDAYCLLHTFYGGPLGWLNKNRVLEPEEEAALRPPPVEPATAPVTLGEADEALLQVLRRDGRATSSELQHSTGQSESAVKRRLERLRSTGVLYFDVQHDTAPLGQAIGAMLWLTVAPTALDDVGHALAAHPEVRFAAAITGNANLVASVASPGTSELYTYLSRKIGTLDGVRAVETTLTLRQVKQLTYEPSR